MWLSRENNNCSITIEYYQKVIKKSFYAAFISELFKEDYFQQCDITYSANLKAKQFLLEDIVA